MKKKEEKNATTDTRVKSFRLKLLFNAYNRIKNIAGSHKQKQRIYTTIKDKTTHCCQLRASCMHIQQYNKLL